MKKYILILFFVMCSNSYAFDPPVEGEDFGVHFGKYNAGIQDNENAIANKADASSVSNVDNTSDLNKPVSTATQTALDLKANTSSVSNVNNTSDADKPISTATQDALDLKANEGAQATFSELSVEGNDGENAIFFDDQSIQPNITGKTGLYRLGNTMYKAENGIGTPIGSGGTVDAYTKAETDDLLDLKANQATTYTKDEVDALIDAALGFPLVSIIAPTDAQWITESPYTGFNGTSSDTGSISAMEWKLEAGGTYVATTGTTTWSVDSVPVTQGANTLYARATDNEANETEKTVTFNVDSIAPVIVADADSTHDGASTVAGGLVLTEVNPNSITFTAVNATPTSGAMSGSDPNYVTPALTPDGTSDITVTYAASDLAGNVATGNDLVQSFVYTALSFDYHWNFSDGLEPSDGVWSSAGTVDYSGNTMALSPSSYAEVTLPVGYDEVWICIEFSFDATPDTSGATLLGVYDSNTTQVLTNVGSASTVRMVRFDTYENITLTDPATVTPSTTYYMFLHSKANTIGGADPEAGNGTRQLWVSTTKDRSATSLDVFNDNLSGTVNKLRFGAVGGTNTVIRNIYIDSAEFTSVP